MSRPIPKPAFDVEATKKIAEKYKDLKPAESTKRPDGCACQWHSPEPGMEVRIGTSSQCVLHSVPFNP